VMKKLGLLVIASIVIGVVAGCSDAEPPNPPGAEANSNKSYTKEDANAAQPVRGDALKEKGE